MGDFGYLHCGEFLVPEEIDFKVNTHLSYHIKDEVNGYMRLFCRVYASLYA